MERRPLSAERRALDGVLSSLDYVQRQPLKRSTAVAELPSCQGRSSCLSLLVESFPISLGAESAPCLATGVAMTGILPTFTGFPTPSAVSFPGCGIWAQQRAHAGSWPVALFFAGEEAQG